MPVILRVWRVIAMVSNINIFGTDQVHAIGSVEVSILILLFFKPRWKSSWMIKYFYTVIVSMESMSEVFEGSYRLKINLLISPE